MDREALNLLEKILFSGRPQSAESLMAYFNISKRTLYYRIATIKEFLGKHNLEIKNKKGVGYFIEVRNKMKVIRAIATIKQIINLDDLTEIALYLLLKENNISLNDLSKKFYYDTSTIRQQIHRLNSSQETFKLKSSHGGMLEIIGEEQEIRMELLQLIKKRLLIYPLNEIASGMKKSFPNLQSEIDFKRIEYIYETVARTAISENIWISEDALQDLVLYLFILDHRFGYACWIQQPQELVFIEEWEFGKRLLEKLYYHQNIEEEANLLLPVLINLNIFCKRLTIIDESVQTVIHQIIEQADFKHLGQVNRTSLIFDLIPHLSYYVKKIHQGFSTRENPLLAEIKLDYPCFYNTAKQLFQDFCNRLQISFSESEASYVAIYIYKNTKTSVKENLRVVIVCGTGRGVSLLLQSRVEELIPNITIVATLSSTRELSAKLRNTTDLVLTTLPIKIDGIPTIRISPLLSNADIHSIYSFMNKKPKVTSSQSLDYIDSRLFQEESVKVVYKILFSLYHMLQEISDIYPITNENIFGLCIHMMLAIQRLIHNEQHLTSEESIQEMIQIIESEHKELSNFVNHFIHLLENELQVTISYSEKYAIYQYLIH